MSVNWPADPIAAVTHHDPYPYYADLARRAPLAYDEKLRCWVAAGAQEVEAVLSSPDCRVRPPDEPVPMAIVGTRAGDLFRTFARTNDGDVHERLRTIACSRLDRFDIANARVRARAVAHELLGRSPAPDVNAFGELLPALVVADLLGVPEPDRGHVPVWTRRLVRSAAPGATTDDAAAGAAAAKGLEGALDVRNGAAGDDTVAAEIGFLFQAYDATAGFIGNTLRALRDRALGDGPSLHATLAAVLSDDPPVQNTRRVAAVATTIAGRKVRAGDALLVVLAAANRDPAARASFSFGAGPHRCPGEALATAIAYAGLESLLAAGLDPEQLGPITYRRSVNVRVAQFGGSS
jgi:cytochrome P450